MCKDRSTTDHELDVPVLAAESMNDASCHHVVHRIPKRANVFFVLAAQSGLVPPARFNRASILETARRTKKTARSRPLFSREDRQSLVTAKEGFAEQSFV